MEKEVKTALESCYGSISTGLVFTSRRMLHVAHKDVLSTTQKTLVLYEYKRHCDNWYVERTSQGLQNRIKQRVPQWLRQQLTVHADLNHTDRANKTTPHRIVTLPLVNVF